MNDVIEIHKIMGISALFVQSREIGMFALFSRWGGWGRRGLDELPPPPSFELWAQTESPKPAASFENGLETRPF